MTDSQIEELRREVRDFLEASWDPERYAEDLAGLGGPGGPVGTGHAVGPWHRELQQARLVAPHWPEQYGGRGLGPAERLVVLEELDRVGAPGPGNPIGIGWAGPTLLAFGTEAQRDRFLPRIVAGDEIWCQLFSEPGAGSDLGNLATRAVRDGDGWSVSGQKTWTSLGAAADWGILLARTDPDRPKHEGITFFLIAMDQPGVEVRPLRQMTGREEFCEVFLDGARVEPDHVVGEVGEGWRVAMTTLMNERVNLTTGTGALWGGGPSFSDLLELVREVRARREMAAALYGEERVLGFMRMRVAEALARGEVPEVQASIQKLLADRFGKRLTEAALEVLGPTGMLWRDERSARGAAWADGFLFSPGLTLGGGTEEVQKNILGERALGLPPEPRVDKDRTWRDLQRG